MHIWRAAACTHTRGRRPVGSCVKAHGMEALTAPRRNQGAVRLSDCTPRDRRYHLPKAMHGDSLETSRALALTATVTYMTNNIAVPAVNSQNRPMVAIATMCTMWSSNNKPTLQFPMLCISWHKYGAGAPNVVSVDVSSPSETL
jgi:hypothetical protein